MEAAAAEAHVMATETVVTQAQAQGPTDDLRIAADALGHLAVDHYHDFKQYLAIYFDSPERIDILNATAPGFFADLERWLLDRIVLNVRKILDPATSGSNKKSPKTNLTLPAFHEWAQTNHNYPAAEASELLTKLRNLAAHVEPWRNHIVAHIDREAALGRSKAVYELVPSEIAEFYATLDRFFELSYRSLWNTVFPLDASATSDAQELMLACRHGAVLSELLDKDVMAYDALMLGSAFGGQ